MMEMKKCCNHPFLVRQPDPRVPGDNTSMALQNAERLRDLLSNSGAFCHQFCIKLLAFSSTALYQISWFSFLCPTLLVTQVRVDDPAPSGILVYCFPCAFMVYHTGHDETLCAAACRQGFFAHHPSPFY